jgi:alpha-1,2-mannosyltransferase
VPVLVLVVAAAVAGGLRGGLTDLFVYRHAGQRVLDELPVYGVRDPVMDLPFTYPPFGALVMVPVGLVPQWVADAAWTAASVAALAGTVVIARRALGRPAPGWLVVAVVLAALAMEPVWQTLTFGQVNAVLMLAVLVDVVRPEKKWSGVLTGVAAGIKLEPLLFVVLLVLIRQPAAAVRATLAVATTIGIGHLVMPGASATYWSDRLVDASRVGPPGLAHNQSVYGALTRLLDGEPSTWLWLVVAGPLALTATLVAVGWWRRDRVLGTCLTAVGMLLLSPVSWSHHWVWALPLALALWEHSRRVALACTVVLVLRPMLWAPWGEQREYGWSPVEHLVGNGYLLAALSLTAWAALRLRALTSGHSAAAGPPIRGPRATQWPEVGDGVAVGEGSDHTPSSQARCSTARGPARSHPRSATQSSDR